MPRTVTDPIYRVEVRSLINEAVDLICRGETREQAQETFDWFVKADGAATFGPDGTRRLVVVEDPS